MYTNLNESINDNKFKLSIRILMVCIICLKPTLAERDIFDVEETTKYDIRCNYSLFLVFISFSLRLRFDHNLDVGSLDRKGFDCF